MLNNKKGLESPRIIIYTLFVGILLLLGIFLMHGLTTNVCTVSNYKLANMDFNSIATKLVYSSECYAAVENYPSGNPSAVPRPGLLDKSKTYADNGEFINLERCVDLPTREQLAALDPPKRPVYEMKLERLVWEEGELTKVLLASTEETLSTVTLPEPDTDFDGLTDDIDDDDDGDGILDDGDRSGFAGDNPCGGLVVDDCDDNCRLVANAEQIDDDQDGIGNLCVDDFDGDFVSDFQDNCPSISNAAQGDTDGDGIGDACDTVDNTATELSSDVCTSARWDRTDPMLVKIKDGLDTFDAVLTLCIESAEITSEEGVCV